MSDRPIPYSISYLGPVGTYTEAAALSYVRLLEEKTGDSLMLSPYPSIAKTLQAVANLETQFALVPVENSTEGSVNVTLDTLWQLDTLQIQQAIVLPISHALVSKAQALSNVEMIYSHPQALAQCQVWLESNLPSVKLIPTNSNTEAFQHLEENHHIGAIASLRAAQLYNLPVLTHPINDHPDNCTRFWVLSLRPSTEGSHTSLALSLPANVPGALAQVLQILAARDINLSRIESRPTKRSLGEYLFFIDIEGELKSAPVQEALVELKTCAETLKIFGSYSIVSAQNAVDK